ncbi:hypothetical protein GCM10007962_11720 [Yeosuana aromativorans]|uniref:DUF4138 domain-containing protein n=1 Tax=Yeosuana aromativorans TaxID=288019 RepID=A0A8J3FF14_9FLAO|nr:DUF4138 domain-containing protein [Yeosuana aromativorans]GGK19242.1 hypothetical protein GCM10007962_11720 [Yeosuana aromativorans]
MKTYITLLILIYSMSISAQQPLDTIYANDQKNVALFFPNPIRQGITGASHFVFTYNREKEQYFGLLQAKPGTESNLLTVTNDGKVYSYILKYSEKLTKLNYFIDKNESIGSEQPEHIKQKPVVAPLNEYANRITHFQKMSEYLLSSSFENIATKRKKGIKVQLQKMVYDASEVYLVIEIKNRSGIDFEIDYLNVYRTNGNNKRKASYQRLRQEVIYRYKIPEAIENGQSQRFVYVLPKFVLGDNEKLILELKEINGSRKIIL